MPILKHPLTYISELTASNQEKQKIIVGLIIICRYVLLSSLGRLIPCKHLVAGILKYQLYNSHVLNGYYIDSRFCLASGALSTRMYPPRARRIRP